MFFVCWVISLGMIDLTVGFSFPSLPTPLGVSLEDLVSGGQGLGDSLDSPGAVFIPVPCSWYPFHRGVLFWYLTLQLVVLGCFMRRVAH